MKRLFIFVSCIIMFSFYSSLYADQVDIDFEKGVELYNNGDYKSSIEVFSDLLNKGYRQPEIYYNLGCAYFRDGNLGHAILNLNRALLLNPSDEDINVNLGYAKQFVIDKIEEPKRSAFESMINALVNLFNINTGLLITSVTLWLLCLMIIAIIWFKWKDKAAWYLLSIFIALFAVSSLIGILQIKKEATSHPGVLLSDQADVRTGPGEDFSLQFTAHEGLEFQLETQQEGYWRIRLKNGIKGWIIENAVGEI
ncbi:MAG: tetratricopeptide repeat protein [candidate division Zixibacteria bacterium]|nr:tetratricopeptide repeat protein [candidate division Zixibacteria bacterium]